MEKTNEKMNSNMELYNAVRSVPESAKTPYNTGRFSGTNVNGMWRIRVLTEQFGPAGVGFWIERLRTWTETNVDGSIAAFVDINLYVRMNGEWSKPIFGTGGSKLVSVEKKYNRTTGECEESLYLSDEAYKMAYTDAISVACKALGIAADVYYEKDKSKYTAADEANTAAQRAEEKAGMAASSRKTLQPGKPGWKETIAWLSDLKKDPQTVRRNYNITEEDFQALCRAAGRAS